MGHSIYPTMLGVREANLFYPALPQEEKKQITIEEFAVEIYRMLIESGDIKIIINYEWCTEQGKKNGLINDYSLRRDFDDNGVIIRQYEVPFVMPTREGNEYIASLLKKKYPDFDEEMAYRIIELKEMG